jgi:hypothetical protein
VRAYSQPDYGGERDEKDPRGRRRPTVQEQDLRDGVPIQHRGGVSSQSQKGARSPSRIPARPARSRPELRPLRAASLAPEGEVRRGYAGCLYGRLPLARPKRPRRRRARGRLRPRRRPQRLYEGSADWEMAGVAISSSRLSLWTLGDVGGLTRGLPAGPALHLVAPPRRVRACVRGRDEGV